MRLLDTSLIQPLEFLGNAIPKYAILSHTWGKEEVSFKDMGTQKSKKLAGYSKIVNCCNLAKKHGLGYVWIDTCCIDKSSSAEVSEAINSMYSWYENAEECYAYLSDILLPTNTSSAHKKFVESRWFKRGWTLQELLAPRMVLFFDQQWRDIGTKDSLEPYICSVTGIHPRNLYYEGPCSASIATKMSWASSRETTRIEDMAYCLLGIFDVHMPLLYGEGEKAFMRLQRKLIKKGDDESIFAWTVQPRKELTYALSGMLAQSPANFATSRTVVPIDLPGMRQVPLSVTSGGLAMTLAFKRCEPDHETRGMDCYMAPLACADVKDIHTPLMLYLCRTSDGRMVRRWDGTLQFGKLPSEDFEIDTFHIKLDYWSGWAMSEAYLFIRPEHEDLFIVQLTPAASDCLRLIRTRLQGGKLDFDNLERTYTWRRPGALCHWILLKFQYDEEQFVDVVRKDEEWPGSSDDYCAKIGLRVTRQEQLVQGVLYTGHNLNTREYNLTAGDSPTEDDMSISSVSDETSAASDTRDDENEYEESMDGFTWIKIHDRYSIQLGKEKVLWFAPKKLSSDEFRDCELVEIDVSSFNREKIF